MGVGRNRDGRGIRQTEMPRERGLHARDQFPEHQTPFVAGKPRRIAPALLLRRKRHVGPVMMAVTGKVDPVGRGRLEVGEMRAEIKHAHDA
ncbi:hypothetical protein CEE86_13500 [Lactobacillus crispatus]|nr:hypothetical protein CEE86_13500 [Lactobacillus crispatus]